MYPAPLSEMGHRSVLELQRSGISAVSGVTGEGGGKEEGGADLTLNLTTPL